MRRTVNDEDAINYIIIIIIIIIIIYYYYYYYYYLLLLLLLLWDAGEKKYICVYRAPNDDFVLNTLKTLFRLYRNAC